MTVRPGEIRDRQIDWNTARMRVWARDYAIQTASTGNLNTGLAAAYSVGGPRLAQLATDSATVGIQFDATSEAVTLNVWATDIDNKFPIYVRHLWTTHARVGGSSGPAVLLRTRFSSVTSASRINTSTTALDRTIDWSTKTSVPEFTPKWTGWGKIGPKGTGTLAYEGTFPENTVYFTLDTDVQSVPATLVIGSQFVYLIATEIEYTPRRTFGDGSRVEAHHLVSDISNMAGGSTNHLP